MLRRPPTAKMRWAEGALAIMVPMTETLQTRWRWARFSLRALLLCIAGLCVLLAVQVNSANKQRRAVARLRELGASAGFDRDLNNLSAGYQGSTWLRDLIGIHYVATCNYVHFHKPIPSDRDLEVLRELPYLECVDLGLSDVSGDALVHLRDLKYLTNLYLGDKSATDQGLKHLQDLTQLQVLQIGTDPPISRVTNAGLSHLARLKNLTQLGIENSPEISDEGLAHLEGLTKLKTLMVRGTGVTYASSIRKKIPNCLILYPVPQTKNSYTLPVPGET